MSVIEQARKAAQLTLAEVASSINRDALWLQVRESGQTPLAPDLEKLILTAIRRLERFAKSVAEAKEKLTSDLKLPPLRTTPSKPRPPQPHAA